MANMAKARKLNHLRERMRREAEELEMRGQDDQAEELREQIAEVGEKAEAIKQAHLRKKREARRRRREAQARQAKADAELEAELARRQEAREWYKKWIAFYGGRPQPAEQVLDAAERAGHDPADLEAAVVRVKRLKDGVHCLAFKGSYLRGEFRPVKELPSHTKV